MDRSLKNQFSVSHNEDMYQETYDPRTMQLRRTWISVRFEASDFPIPLRYALFCIANVDSLGRFYVGPGYKNMDYNNLN